MCKVVELSTQPGSSVGHDPDNFILEYIYIAKKICRLCNKRSAAIKATAGHATQLLRQMSDPCIICFEINLFFNGLLPSAKGDRVRGATTGHAT